MHDTLPWLIDHWKNDPQGTDNRWFLWVERLKNFRSIRRGIGQVMRDIEAGTFGNLYRGSTLETAVHSVAEPRQIFEGADHAFCGSASCVSRTSTTARRTSAPSPICFTRAIVVTRPRL